MFVVLSIKDSTKSCHKQSIAIQDSIKWDKLACCITQITVFY